MPIDGNSRPWRAGGAGPETYPWSVKLLKARTLLDAAHDAGLKAATVTWPVTVDAPVQFNLPEYFQRRRGGSMDTGSIESRSTPRDLVTRIAAMFPSFRQEWMDDRTRTLAVVFLLKTEKPDLLLVHLLDLDSEEHDNAPFSRESNAILEYTDELVGQMMDALPTGSAVALVSDHGFEKVEAEVNLNVLAAKARVTGIRSLGGLALADTSEASAFLRQTSKDAQYGIGRAIPKEELMRFAPQYANADSAFEPVPGFMFRGDASGEIFTKPREIGNHGHWPTRYRSVYVMWAPGISAKRLPEILLKDIAARLALVLGMPFTPGPK